MDFFGREKEIAALRKIREMSHESAKFTVLTGRRRVGKTELVKRALGDGKDDFVYLLVTRQAEKTLCQTLQGEIEESTGIPFIGQATRFIELFEAVAKIAMQKPITLVIDEFQEFDRINPAIFDEIRGKWDDYHGKSKLNLVVCGSVYRLMHKIFFSYAEPLYGRNTGHIRLKPFDAKTMKEIFSRYSPRFTNGDLLALWTVTGGVARYVQLLMDGKATTQRKMVSAFLDEASPFREEGRAMLAEEFGPDHGLYFSLLSEIAAGKTTFRELETSVGKDVGTCLARLENEYGLIKRNVPVFDRETSRNSFYSIDDCFLRFWFRFVFKYRGWLELGRYKALEEVIARDFVTFSGHSLEQYFRWKFACESTYTRMGAWWDRKGENEIDLVCEDEPVGRLDFFEVKRDPKRFDGDLLRRKAEAFLTKNPSLRQRSLSFAGLSLRDM